MAFILMGLGMTGAALSAGALLPTETSAQNRSRNRRLSPADAALLRLVAWAEIVRAICGPNMLNLAESDLRAVALHKRTKNFRDS